jgi:hypothetical protein
MKPTRKQETGMAIAVVIVIISLLFLCSCSGRKTITEYIVTHDTLVVGHTDTLHIVSQTTLRDTVRESTIQYVTIRKDSDRVDTLRVETFRDYYHTYWAHDSVDTYKAVADSLRKVLDKQKEKTVKTKPLIPLWQKLLFLALVFALCLIILKSRMK